MLRGVSRFWSVVVLWSCVLFCCSVSAQASTVHVLAGQFGSEGSGSGQFKGPLGIAVNDTTHDVYVVDSGDHRVEEFNSTGSTLLAEFAPPGGFSEPTQIAVDNSGDPLDPSDGDVYVVDSGHGVIDKFTETGVYVGSLTGTCEAEKESPPCGKSKFVPFVKGESGLQDVAVDPTGTLWVDEYRGSIYSFGDGLVNEYISRRETIYGAGLEALGVDSEDNLYVQHSILTTAKVSNLGVKLVDPFGLEEETSGIAVDPRAGEVYIDYDTTIGAFTLGGSQIESFGSEEELPLNQYGTSASKGVAVDASNGTVYVTAFTADEVLIFDAVTLPTVRLEPLTEQRPKEVTLNGTVNPEGSLVTSCKFEYEENNPHSTVEVLPCEPSNIGGGTSVVPVKKNLKGLVPEMEYNYRLVAENAAGIPATVAGKFLTGPVLGGESVTDVASESATLNAPIDPNGDDTSYYFQYGLTTSYEYEVPVPSPGVDIGSALGVQNVSVHVQDHLIPGTTYHYRVVVLQNGEEFVEPDRMFRTQSVVGKLVLSDGRAWELVSPPNKKGALIEQFSNGVGDEIQAASNGSGITYLSAGPAVGAEPQGKISWSQTLSERVSGGGWGSQDLSIPRRIPEDGEPPADDEGKPEYDAFSSDLAFGIVEPPVLGTPSLAPEAPERTVYRRDNQDDTYMPLVWTGNVPNEEELFWALKSDEQLYFVTATSDLSHVLLASPRAFTPEAVYENSYLTSNQWNLYEWSAGRLQLVNILPEDEGGEPTHSVEPNIRLAGGTEDEGHPQDVNPSAISSDGRRIAWDLGVPGEKAKPYKGLYVRDMVDENTIEVGGSNAMFQWMSSDGSKVFFLEDGDLHVCEIVEAAGKISCAFSDLTADHGAGETSGVQGLVSDVSENGSYVYFVATGVLGGASGAVSGGDNLYVLHDDGGVWSTSFIATLSSGDLKTWDKVDEQLSDLSGVSSRVSSDGRWLAFMSDRSLTGYDNTDAVSGRPDEEVFLYHAPEDLATESGSLVCGSCNPTGARPVGVFDEVHKPLLVDRDEVWVGSWLAGSIPGWDKNFVAGSQYQPRYLSDSGRLFFDSPDELVPHATNGVEDVYEYEPVGVGGCAEGVSSGDTVYSGSSDGCVGLISSGVSGQESAFFDASENGDDVFFITAAKLVSADYDNGYDVYDAHVCSSEGVPCVVAPVPSPPCSSGDSCKAAPSPQPEIFGPAPSATFSGVGNVIEEVKPVAKSKSKAKPKKKKAKKKRKARKSRAGRAKKLRVGGRGGR